MCSVLLRRVVVAAGTLGAATAAPSSRADPPGHAASTPDARRAAAREFARGEKAFQGGDFTLAAASFETAHRLAPHPDALWNAARAWHRAGEAAHAANDYARYLREAPPGAPDRNSATSALTQLAAKVGRIDVHAPSAESVTVDEVALAGGSFRDGAAADGAPSEVYVAPGAHVVRARFATGEREQRAVVSAGQTVSVAFDDAATEGPASPSPPPVAARSADLPPRDARGWPPWVVAAFGGLAVVAGTATVISAIDTRHARDRFLAQPTDEGLDDGRAKQTRTNVLLGITGALTVTAAATAIWLVDWRGAPARGVAVRPFAATAARDTVAGVVAAGTF